MTEIEVQNSLLPSLKRALSGVVVSSLRQASIDADFTLQIVKILYEIAPAATAEDRDLLAVAAAEVIADFSLPWRIDERYSVAPTLSPLANVGYRRVAARHVSPPPEADVHGQGRHRKWLVKRYGSLGQSH